MTAQADVLVVMDAAIHKLCAESSGSEFAGDLLEARAAVAELIEACAPVLRHDSAFDTGPEAHLRAALASVQGGAK